MAITGAAPTELGTEKIGKLLKMYAVPGIIAQTASSLYNMVDSIYIGHLKDVGSYAISGLAVTFPLMNLSAALGTLVGLGAMTLISVLLGQKNYKQANKVLSNVLTLNTTIGILFTIVTLSFLEPILTFFGASESTMPFAKSYMQIILCGNVITHLYFGLNGLIRSAGNPKTSMALTLFTVGSNTILDPILIFGFGMGVRGAAVATVICQFMALCYSLYYFSDKKKVLHFEKPLFQIDLRVAKSSMAIGLGPFLMNSAACLVTLFINQQLKRYGGDLAIGAYGIANRITFVFVMIIIGLNQGLQPIAGYNFGARQYSRVREVYSMTAKWAILVSTLCFIVSVFFPGQAVGIFTNDPEMLLLSEKGIRIMNCMFALVGFCIVSSSLFQTLGMVKISIFLSLSRQLIFLIPLVYFLPMLFEQNGVWMSFAISDITSVLVTLFFVVRLFRKLGKLNDGDDAASLGSSLNL